MCIQHTLLYIVITHYKCCSLSSSASFSSRLARLFTFTLSWSFVLNENIFEILLLGEEPLVRSTIRCYKRTTKWQENLNNNLYTCNISYHWCKWTRNTLKSIHVTQYMYRLVNFIQVIEKKKFSLWTCTCIHTVLCVHVVYIMAHTSLSDDPSSSVSVRSTISSEITAAVSKFIPLENRIKNYTTSIQIHIIQKSYGTILITGTAAH